MNHNAIGTPGVVGTAVSNPENIEAPFNVIIEQPTYVTSHMLLFDEKILFQHRPDHFMKINIKIHT